MLSTKQLEDGVVAVSRSANRSVAGVHADQVRYTVEVDTAARWRDQLAVIARARAPRSRGARQTANHYAMIYRTSWR